MSDDPYLSGNFAPVEGELTAQDLPVRGEIPEALEGRFLRIGPNPVTPPDPKTHHWFLGNGMAHGVRLRGGRAEWYRRRYVRDDAVCEAMGWPPVEGPRPSDLGGGLANTNIIGLAGRTYAIVEAGNLPVELSDDLETLARSDFGGTLPAGFSAHPKVDPDSGEVHAAVYEPAWDHVQHLVLGPDGRVRRTVDVPVAGKPMVHDCALTPSWFVILDLPVVFTPEALEGGFFPYRWSEDHGARVGLLPRLGGPEEVVWCEVGPCYVFHPMNAFEDADGRVVIDVARHPKMFATDVNGPNDGRPTLDRWVVDPKGGPVKESRLSERGEEFPRIDDRRAGKPYRFGYSGQLEPGPTMGVLLKHDLATGSVELHEEGPARQFMEPCFVPRTPDADEDDGWILAYAHDAETRRGEVVILEARDFAAPPIARVELPDRVPFGFHGNWLPDEA